MVHNVNERLERFGDWGRGQLCEGAARRGTLFTPLLAGHSRVLRHQGFAFERPVSISSNYALWITNRFRSLAVQSVFRFAPVRTGRRAVISRRMILTVCGAIFNA